jgi:hypothetical protein
LQAAAGQKRKRQNPVSARIVVPFAEHEDEFLRKVRVRS